jgi:UDP-N-acetyl-D-mannosaminuronic acid dehydrogenase
MNLARIALRDVTLGVVGLGTAGLPLAAILAETGFKVLGMDENEMHVSALRRGEIPRGGDEPGLSTLLKGLSPERFRLTTSKAELSQCDVVFVNVDTPTNANNIPEYDALKRACAAIGSVMKRGVLVIIESTLAPGTMQTIVAPALEQASGYVLRKDFFLGHSPERVMPGKLLKNIVELARICGGCSPETGSLMRALYETFVHGEVSETDWLTAELVKTAENAYRDVNIAFANELALICEHAGADFLRVRTLVNTSPERHVLLAGAGVGGHCMVKDPWLLAHGAPRVDAALIASARARNDGMPAHMLALTAAALEREGIALAQSTITVLGYSYLENSGDPRNSPSETFSELARSAGANIRIHDPWIPAYQGDLIELLQGADCAVIMVAHRAYAEMDPNALAARLARRILIDGRHVFADREQTMHAIHYVRLGRGLP